MLYVIPLNPHTQRERERETETETETERELKSSKNGMYEYCKVDINELEQIFLKKYFG